MTVSISTAIFCTAFLLQFFIWLAFSVGYRRARTVLGSAGRDPFRKQADSGFSLPPVSVVVAARNEEGSLPDLIGALDAQDHDEFEVIVVDDASNDETAALVSDFSKTRPWLRLIRIYEPIYPRKKMALGEGIAAAKYDVLAFTDADCRPPPEWLTHIAKAHAAYGEDVVVVGYALFDREPGLLNLFARYVALLSTFQAAATIGLRFPFMAFGTNLSYRKRTFDLVGGFADGLVSMSGDDDLFVQHVHARRVAEIVWMPDQEAVVRTRAMTTLRTWFVQKKRHTSANRYFVWQVKFAGFVYWFSLVLLLLAPFFAGWSGLAALVGIMLVHALCIGNAFCHFEAQDLIPRLPVAATLYSVYNAIMPVLGFFNPQKRWK